MKFTQVFSALLLSVGLIAGVGCAGTKRTEFKASEAAPTTSTATAANTRTAPAASATSTATTTTVAPMPPSPPTLPEAPAPVVTLPGAPANLSATSGGDAEVVLTWTGSPGATGYDIYRSTTQNDTNIRRVASNVSETTYRDKGLRNDSTFYFRVKATNAGGASAFSSEIAASTKVTKKPLPDGVYTLSPRITPHLRLEVREGKLSVAPKELSATAQRWMLTGLDLTTYRISPVDAGDHALDITSESTASDAAVVIAAYRDRASQKWTLTLTKTGFRLTPLHAPTLALTSDGTRVTQQTSAESNAQTWIILPLPEGGPDGMPDPGTAYVPAGYKLVFGDEFTGDKIDLEKWETRAPFSQPHLNEEMENYLPEAVTLRNGTCVLTAEPHDSICILADKVPAPHCLGKHTWRSGAITSRGTFRHGYYEARFKVPQGVGMWPAFWTTSSKRWPPEWDIVEIQNIVGTLYQYMHPTKAAKLTWVDGVIGRDSVYTTAKGMPNPYDGYVVYGALVTPKGVAFWINGKLTSQWEVSADTIDPMWVSCNLAVGGKWAGAPDATTPKQNEMILDYVRVYQSDEVEAEVQAMLAAMPPKPAPKQDDK